MYLLFFLEMSDFSLEICWVMTWAFLHFPWFFELHFWDTIRQSFGGVPPVWGLARRSARWHNWKEPVEDSI